MNYLRDDAPVKADMLVLGARLPRKEEIPTNPTPKRISAAVMQDETGKMFTAIERRNLCATTSDLNNPEVMTAQTTPFDYEAFYQEVLLQPAKSFYAEFMQAPVGADTGRSGKIVDFKCEGTRTKQLTGERANAAVLDDFSALEERIIDAEAERLLWLEQCRLAKKRLLHASNYGAPL
jgi:hypothetical protein